VTGVKVIELGETVPSDRSELLNPMVTLAVGIEFITTVKVSDCPVSLV
jgi:hypothetical protein